MGKQPSYLMPVGQQPDGRAEGDRHPVREQCDDELRRIQNRVIDMTQAANSRESE
jgi:aryl-alcohol dehydrogenase-like predicted oxidoreductase